MEQDLISKKDLLDLTEISYGQLYRWKRKKLIPEDWFIRKSTFTGQETFFPRDQILDRIEKIKNHKEDLSLDELATLFSPSSGIVVLTIDQLIKDNIVTQKTLEICPNELGHKQNFSFVETFCLYILDQTLTSGEVTQEESLSLFQLLFTHQESILQNPSTLLLLRKFGVSITMIITQNAPVLLDEMTKLVIQYSLPQKQEELKQRLS